MDVTVKKPFKFGNSGSIAVILPKKMLKKLSISVEDPLELKSDEKMTITLSKYIPRG